MAKTSERLAYLTETAGFDQSYVIRGGMIRVQCSQCQASTVNGIACHETGCPNQSFECKGCNNRVQRRGAYCPDCL